MGCGIYSCVLTDCEQKQAEKLFDAIYEALEAQPLMMTAYHAPSIK